MACDTTLSHRPTIERPRGRVLNRASSNRIDMCRTEPKAEACCSSGIAVWGVLTASEVPPRLLSASRACCPGGRHLLGERASWCHHQVLCVVPLSFPCSCSFRPWSAPREPPFFPGAYSTCRVTHRSVLRPLPSKAPPRQPDRRPLGVRWPAKTAASSSRGWRRATYRFRVTFPGFLEAETDVVVSPLNNTYDLGDIRLPRIEGFKEEVTVTGGNHPARRHRHAGLQDGRRSVAVDRHDPRRDEESSRVSPSIRKGQVSLRGSDKVAILIDGRQSSLTGFGSQRGLDSVSAANIEAIEIINNPSARFDAAGMAGIINIIYKKEQQLGWSGDVGFGLGVGQFTKQRRDLPTDLGSFTNNEKVIPSVNLNYRTPRTRTFMQGELLLQDQLPNNEFTTRFYDDGRVIESQVPENREQYIYTVRGGSDFTLNDTNTITVSGVHNYEHHIDVAQVPFILQATGQRERFWFWREDEGTGFTNANVDLHAQVRRAGPRAGRQPSVHAREGRRGVLPERGVADPDRHRRHAHHRHRKHAAAQHRLHAAAADRPPGARHQVAAPLDSGHLHRAARRPECDLPGPRGLLGLGRKHLRRLRQPRPHYAALHARRRPPARGNAGLLHDSRREHLLPGERRVRLFRRVPEREAHVEPDEHQPAHHGLQPARRPSRRTGAPHLPEVRRSGNSESGEPVPAAPVHQRVRSGILALMGGGHGQRRRLPPRRQRCVPADLRDRRLESQLRHRQPHLRERRQLPPDRRAVDGIAGDRSRLADDRQRELVPERHRGARYDTVLPDADGRSRCPARRTTPGT